MKFQNTGNELGAIAGGLTAIIGVYALRVQKGAKRSAELELNLLAQVFDLQPVEPNKFPPAIWNYLNSCEPEQKRTRREQLIQRWRRSLSTPVAQDVLQVAEFVHLNLRDSLIEPDKPIRFLYFPESGVMSLLTPMEDGSLIEIANIGTEGLVGIPLVLGVSSTAEIAICQVEGSAWRIEAERFLFLTKKHPELFTLCQRYAATLFDQIAQNTACAHSHSIEERCARWLLMTHDRCPGDQFVLTQESLALMLGASRTTVNLAAGMLSKAQLISYVRGKITILDRKGLEDVSCQCYIAVTKYFDKVMNHSVPITSSNGGNGKTNES